jgi:hypothetical protein
MVGWIPAHLIITLFQNDEKKCDILGSCSPFVAILHSENW